jgi:hypothetical protein
MVVNATSFDCTAANISSLEGIQYFDNLQELRGVFRIISPSFLLSRLR